MGRRAGPRDSCLGGPVSLDSLLLGERSFRGIWQRFLLSFLFRSCDRGAAVGSLVPEAVAPARYAPSRRYDDRWQTSVELHDWQAPNINRPYWQPPRIGRSSAQRESSLFVNPQKWERCVVVAHRMLLDGQKLTPRSVWADGDWLHPLSVRAKLCQTHFLDGSHP